MRFKFLPTLGLVLVMNISSIKAASWEALPSLPVASGNFVCGTFGHDIIIAGGITWKDDTKIWLDQISRFDTKKKSWSEAGHLPHPMAYAAFAQTERGIYFSGGSDGKVTQNNFCLLNTKLELKKITEISQPLVYSGAAVSGSKLFVVAGGSDVVDLKTLTNSFYSIDLVSGKTEALPDFPGGKYIVPTMAALGGHLFVFTGAYLDADGKAINMDSAFVYDVKSASWKNIKPYPFPVRGLASCVLDDRHILLGGGYTQDFTDAAFIYDTKTDSYFKTTPLPYRGMVSLVKTGNDLYCLGGEDKMRHRSDLFYRTAWKDLLQEQK